MSGYLAQVARLLNVDGYAVLQLRTADQAVELNVPLLRQQFLGRVAAMPDAISPARRRGGHRRAAARHRAAGGP